VDTQGLVLMAKVHRANVTDRDGIKLLLEPARSGFLERLSRAPLSPVAGRRIHGRKQRRRLGGEDSWVEKTLGWRRLLGGPRRSFRHPKKPAPEEVMMRWAREWAKEGVAIDLQKFMPPKRPRPFLPKRWIVERTFAWLVQNRRMSLWTTSGLRRARKRSSTWR
jgi:hypothetical protein